MSKNIILLSDGTGNTAAKLNKTNVRRLYEALDLHRHDQVAFYDEGVGSQVFLPLKFWGTVSGYGMKRKVLHLYKCLCRNYSAGDRIYLFGFSRGAFTIRLLSGLIGSCGIYTDYEDEKDLERAARYNYNFLWSWSKIGMLTKVIRASLKVKKPLGRLHRPMIEFIGLWDTVAAYVIPFDWLATFYHALIYPVLLPTYRLSEKVRKACHALSVDDERLTFHPLLYDEREESDQARIEQVWFPGVHSDVGGGYRNYKLSLVTLDWMITKVEAKTSTIGAPGLHFVKRYREEILRDSDWNGFINDSRSSFGALYRYKPRNIEALCNNEKNGVWVREVKIHCSVMERVASNLTSYAPTGLPEFYKVIPTRGKLSSYENPVDAKKRITAMRPVQVGIRIRIMLYYSLFLTNLALLSSLFLLGCLHTDQCTLLITTISPDFLLPWLTTLQGSKIILFIMTLILVNAVLFVIKVKAVRQTKELSAKAWAALNTMKPKKQLNPNINGCRFP